ncbi:FAD-binding oxidoreductase [Roseovarius rhodophyticola]|uniref:FAD-binding oxidoreductase n=1 Tax=Roseovarius rhodophyticola TaxID=3080827 RepID=A0ABZ2TAY3_9RHOB|nr:FAD-binding oxidoreductase [Roseovarius sp. W115]MDV2930554.1 FAD-binding oxidoreductase [Roseovarius sp. W115]
MTQTTHPILDALRKELGAKYVLTGKHAEPFARDWTGQVYTSPLAVLRPADTKDVSQIMQLAYLHEVPVVPVSGRTGLTKGTKADGQLLLSLDRLSAIREIRPAGRIAVVEAGVILSDLHKAADMHDLIFPLTFGARGSAMIGGALSTNAGGSNVVRYGSTRGLCLGLEVVLADGRILDLMSAVHKDNSGYDLRDLMIGAEGTLGIITAAVLRLMPKPLAYASAMLACSSVSAAVDVLNTLQAQTGGAVEAFEYMPASFIEGHLERFPDARAPFEARYDVNIFVEVGALSSRDADPTPEGQIPARAHLEDVLSQMLENGQVLDAVIAQNETQRAEMWARREAAAELSRLHDPIVDNDIAVPVDRMQDLLTRIETRIHALDPDIKMLNVAHLGDGNLHFTAWPKTTDKNTHAAINLAVEEEAIALGGSFSAEHGVGLSKLPAMARHKDKVALDVMRAIKRALDPKNILNPGKVIPAPDDLP